MKAERQNLKNIKSFFAFIIIWILLVCFLPFQNQNAFAFSDVSAEDDAFEAVQVLSKLKVLEGKDENIFAPDEPVTRAETVAMLMRILGYDFSGSYTGTTKFADVTGEHWAAQYIYGAYQIGLVHGTTETSFEPEENVTHEQLLKLLVTLLGYESIGEDKGGYPHGYLTAANTVGLTEGMQVKTGSYATRAEVAQYIYRYLDIPMAEVAFTRAGASVSLNKKTKGTGDTPLSVYFGLCKTDGCVRIPELFTDEGKVYLNGEAFKSCDTGIEEYYGQEVTIWYDKDNNIQFFVTASDNKITKINRENIIKVKISSGKISLQYYDTIGKVKNLYLTVSEYLYNTVLVPEVDDKALLEALENIGYGGITVIQTPDLEDSLMIESGISCVADRADAYNEILYYKDYTDYSVDVLSIPLGDYQEKIYTGITDLSDIRANDVITVYETPNNLRCRIVCTDESVYGAVEKIEDNKITIAGHEYILSPNVNAAWIETGRKTYYYIDSWDYIVGVDVAEAETSNYGILYDVSSYEEGSWWQTPQLKILNADGEYVVLETAEKVRAYNEYTGTVEKVSIYDLICTDPVQAGYTNVSKYMLWYTDNAANFTYDLRYSGDNYAYNKKFYYRPGLTRDEMSDIASRRPIYYRVGSNGKICEIIVADVPEPYNRLTTMNAMDCFSLYYRKQARTAYDMVNGDAFNVASDAMVFSVLATGYEEEDYKRDLRGIGILTEGANKMTCYSLNGSDDVGLIVRYSPFPSETADSMDYTIVESVYRFNNELYLCGYRKGKEIKEKIRDNVNVLDRNLCLDSDGITKITSDNILDAVTATPYDVFTDKSHGEPEDLKVGDIILTGKNGGEEICYIEKVMDRDIGIMQIAAVSNSFIGRMQSSNMYAKGIVREIKNDIARVTIAGPNDLYVRRTSTLADVEAYNSMNTTGGKYAGLNKFYCETQCYTLNSPSTYVWSYDCERQEAETATINELQVGDTVVIRGAVWSPKEIIIMRNIKNEPDISYWECQGY